MIMSASLLICALNRIKAAIAPRVAAADAFGGHPAAFDWAVFFQGLKRIGATGGLIAAIEANPRRKDHAVSADRESKDMGEWGHVGVLCFRLHSGNAAF